MHLILGGLEHDGARVSGFFEPQKIRTLKSNACLTNLILFQVFRRINCHPIEHLSHSRSGTDLV